MKAIWMLLVVFVAQCALASPKSVVKSITEIAGGNAYKVVFADQSAEKDDVDAAREEVLRHWKARHGKKKPKRIETLPQVGLPDPTVVFVFHK